MFFTFLIVVILTAVALVVLAMTVANLIGPKSYNKQKAEPYVSLRVGVRGCSSVWAIISLPFCF